MHRSHQRRVPPDDASVNIGANERGYIMTATLILLPILLGFVALAIDATYFYFRGVQLQRAADSAALAGVVRMPKFNEAVAAAEDILRRNGFENGEENIDVVAQPIKGNTKQFRITVRDNKIGLFFGRVLIPGWKSERTSTAEYISNVPLGSKQSVIGSGYLTDSAPVADKQNFWLAVSGPCAPKESGDQYLSKWDGNSVNQNLPLAPADPPYQRRFAMLCDYDPIAKASSLNYLINNRDAHGGTTVFPAMAQNRDYPAGKAGYDYIVTVPCANGKEPPCPASDVLAQDLVIQVYDPVFNPDSIQRYSQEVISPTAIPRAETHTNEFEDTLRPDKYGAIRPRHLKGCVSVNPDPNRCIADVGTWGTAKNPGPWDVRVLTDFRVFGPDSSPLDYSDDVALTLDKVAAAPAVPNSSNVVLVPSDAEGVTSSEVTNKAVRRFGTCMKWIDNWTAYRPAATATDYANYQFTSLPTADPNITPANLAPVLDPALAAAGWIQEPVPNNDSFWVTPNPTVEGLDNFYTQARCDAYSNRWVTMLRVAAGQKAGRYRLNVRTVESANSFGSNGFSVRAFFSPSSTAEPTVPNSCYTTVPPTCTGTLPSVAGDSSMSVFASVSEPALFYLAQLSPAAVYRDKTVLISLWDPGEGSDSLEILRPRTQHGGQEGASTLGGTCSVEALDASYCVQSFKWSVGRTGITAYNTSNPNTPLFNSDTEYKDVCADAGEPFGAMAEPKLLKVKGTELGSAIPGCSTDQPAPIWASRAFQSDAERRKFNDRLVVVQVKIPLNYGCKLGTGITVNSGTPPAPTFIPCVESESATGPGLPEGGWWKIKYTPQCAVAASTPPCTPYAKVTDRTTWTVGLKGDPVHLIPNA